MPLPGRACSHSALGGSCTAGSVGAVSDESGADPSAAVVDVEVEDEVGSTHCAEVVGEVGVWPDVVDGEPVGEGGGLVPVAGTDVGGWLVGPGPGTAPGVLGVVVAIVAGVVGVDTDGSGDG